MFCSGEYLLKFLPSLVFASFNQNVWLKLVHIYEISPFVLNAPFLYPQKTLENRKVFQCFQVVEKGCIGNEWVMLFALKWENYSERIFFFEASVL